MSQSDETTYTDESWDADGPLGNDEKYAKVTTDITVGELHEAAGLIPVSIRMQPSVLGDLKVIAKYHGIGYQPLIKQILKRFVDSEFRIIVSKQVADKNNDCEINASSGSGEDPLQASA